MSARYAVAGIDADTPLGIAAPALLLSRAEPLFEMEAAARGGADVDAVHDMRVASRRLREALRLFAPLYDEREMRSRYRKVRRVTRALGPVRDADVVIGALEALLPKAGKGARRAIAFLVGYRTGLRERDLVTLNAHLAGLDLRQDRKAFSTAVCAVTDAEAAARPLSAFAHSAISGRLAVVTGAQGAALAETAIQQQHALRIAYKRLRYALETLAPCYGDAFGQPHAVLTSYQDALGELHDAHVFAEMLAAPDLMDLAAPAGVRPEDFAQLAGIISARASAAYTTFSRLAGRYPAPKLERMLLTPLDR